MFALLSILFAVSLSSGLPAISSLSAAVVAVGTQILLPGRKFPGKRPFLVLLKGKSSGNSSGKAYQTRNFFRQLFREQRLATKCSVNLTERIVSIAISSVIFTENFANSQSLPLTLQTVLLKSQFLP